jgi:hypothetical protein
MFAVCSGGGQNQQRGFGNGRRTMSAISPTSLSSILSFDGEKHRSSIALTDGV